MVGGGGASPASPSRQELKAGTVEVRQTLCHQHDKIKAPQEEKKITKNGLQQSKLQKLKPINCINKDLAT